MRYAGQRASSRVTQHSKQVVLKTELLETTTFYSAREKLLTDREYQFVLRQILHPTRVVPTLFGSIGIRKLVWVGAMKGRRRVMQILYHYKRGIGQSEGFSQVTLLHVCQIRDKGAFTPGQLRALRSCMLKETGE